MPDKLIPYEEARKQILDQIDRVGATSQPIERLLGHVTAAPVIARLDAPLFDNSAVDGYGVRVQDLENASDGNEIKLSIKGTVRAGDPAPTTRLGSGAALKILTGACVPSTVEAVVMREYCREENGNVFVSAPVGAGENIRRRGDEFLRGQDVLDAGTLASPPVVALIASLGYRSFDVFRKPRAAVVTTGNELTKPGRRLSPGKIYDSNSYAIESAIKCAGIDDVVKLHAGENLDATKAAFRRAFSFADVVVSTGGVSVGEFDYVKAALEAIGVHTQLWRIAIKPGKPVYFGIVEDARRHKKKYVFGLPGNPVSALVTYHQFVNPAIRKLRGLTRFDEENWLPARLTKQLQKRPGRLEFVRGQLSMNPEGELIVEPTTGQDSHMLSGLACADALIYFAQDAAKIEAGATVKVKIIRWGI